MVITLTRLVGDLRDLSLAEVGRLSLTLAPLDLGELIADLRENMEPVAVDKSITLVADVAPSLPMVDADGDRIRQVLVNLLANALPHIFLGLAIVRSLVTLHGGNVQAESRLGEGSRFTVTLPLR